MSDLASSHRCSVLIVDDDADVRELLRIALTADGYYAAGVEHGRAALNYLRSHADTCIILLDLMLPVMDGVHFRMAQLRDRSLAWIPVIVMSGGPGSDRQARELGARQLVRKPLDLDQIKHALSDVGCCQARPRRVQQLAVGEKPPGLRRDENGFYDRRG
jgi:CheY-like chemotaxis protein